jgi:iron complex outermembrane recepter protein
MIKLWILMRLAVALSFVSSAIAFGSRPGLAQEGERVGEWVSGQVDESEQSIHLPIYPSTPSPVTTVTDWIAQIEAALVQITGVRVEETEAGLQVVIETERDSLEATETRSIGNALIADIPNATTVEEFSQANPIEGIALVSVTSLPGDRVRVAITGTDAPPVAEVISEAQGLAFAVTLGESGTAAEEDAIQVVVTGEQDEGYNPSSASTATRIDTPLRDIPASIQVVPRQVLEDQQPDTLREALRNVPGVVQGDVSQRVPLDTVLIRGFSTDGNTLRNGLPDFTSRVLSFDTAIVEQIEVLRGPASVLYGQGSPGGTISYTTKQPLSQPFYEVEGSVGNFGFYRGSVDLSGPLNADETVLYRLNLAAQTSDSFVDFFNAQRYVVAPTLTWSISDRTRLTLEAEYLEQDTQTFDVGLPAVGTVLPNPNGEIPRDRYLGEPDFDRYDLRVFRVGYNLEHRFSEDWQLRNAFRYSDYRQDRDFVAVTILQNDNRTVDRVTSVQDFTDQFYSLDTYIVGEFATGSIQHQLSR